MENNIGINDYAKYYYELQLGQNPPDGWFVLWTKAHGIFPFHTSDVTGLARKIGVLQEVTDVYVGMALQKTKPEPGKRGTGANATAICGVWIEIDCREGIHKEKKENLPTKGDALRILKSLPVVPTVILDSGGGFHAHWWLDRPWVFHTENERQSGQELVRRFQLFVADIFRKEGWKVDTTSDLARVLRPPMSYNHKTGQVMQVTIPHYDSAARFTVGKLDAYCQSAVVPQVASTPSTTALQVVSEQGTPGKQSYSPVELEPIMKECAWLRHCREDAETLPEPEWFAALSIVARCVNGHEHAHTLSVPYPGYSVAETDAKIEHALTGGPRTCVNIHSTLNAASYCDSCRYFKYQSSPISLGLVKAATALGTGFKKTDAGNAELFARVNAADVRYDWGRQHWVLYDGKKWEADGKNRIIQKAIRTLRQLGDQAIVKLSKEDAKIIAKHALASESAAGLRNMLSLARSFPGLASSPEKFDADPWLFNVQNGTLALEGRVILEPHSRDDLLTKIAGVHYDPNATCPLWDAFLFKIMEGNQRLIAFLRRFAGMSLTGIVREQCLVLLYGTGANGKSVFLEILRYILGDYAMQTDFSTLAASKSPHVRNDLARLVGARFVTAVESEYGQPLAEATIKQMTGGDAIIARFLFKEFFQFYPQFKLWLASNHKPIVKGGDHGIWRRIKLVPFSVTIPVEEQDPDLARKLKGEGPGILNWMIRGCLEWQADGLNPPSEVEEAVAEYRSEMDRIAEFIADHCVVGAGEKVKAKDLYKRTAPSARPKANAPSVKNVSTTCSFSVATGRAKLETLLGLALG